jgi:ribosomal protein S15
VEHAKAEKHKRWDPYALAQARQRKAANIARQEVLQKERAAALGDPVRGIATPFIESLDNAEPYTITPRGNPAPQLSTGADNENGLSVSSTIPTHETHLNYFLTPSEVSRALGYSYALTKPQDASNRNTIDPAMDEAHAQIHAERHENALRAISRIVCLENGNSKDRTRANIQKCIDVFGRHHTDKHLAPKSTSNVARDPSLPPPPEKTPRAGPDTGSPEVQVAILTAKIRVLANHLEGQGGREAGGKKDKYNKRNLRLLVHRRQKMLRYLRTKERGGERWQHLVQTLGLTDGTWKGEISL